MGSPCFEAMLSSICRVRVVCVANRCVKASPLSVGASRAARSRPLALKGMVGCELSLSVWRTMNIDTDCCCPCAIAGKEKATASTITTWMKNDSRMPVVCMIASPNVSLPATYRKSISQMRALAVVIAEQGLGSESSRHGSLAPSETERRSRKRSGSPMPTFWALRLNGGLGVVLRRGSSISLATLVAAQNGCKLPCTTRTRSPGWKRAPSRRSTRR